VNEENMRQKVARGGLCQIIRNLGSGINKRQHRKQVQQSSMTSWPDHLPAGNQKRF
jgi:hypothetical protein